MSALIRRNVTHVELRLAERRRDLEQQLYPLGKPLVDLCRLARWVCLSTSRQHPDGGDVSEEKIAKCLSFNLLRLNKPAQRCFQAVHDLSLIHISLIATIGIALLFRWVGFFFEGKAETVPWMSYIVYSVPISTSLLMIWFIRKNNSMELLVAAADWIAVQCKRFNDTMTIRRFCLRDGASGHGAA